MNSYINGEAIRMFREKKKMTQAELAVKIGVTDKAVSKWETGRGLPDITLVESIAEALGLSIGELFAGEQVINRNVKSNMKEARLYVCPICGNIIQSTGDAAVSCCGVALPALEAEEADGEHRIRVAGAPHQLHPLPDRGPHRDRQAVPGRKRRMPVPATGAGRDAGLLQSSWIVPGENLKKTAFMQRKATNYCKLC